MTQLDAGFIANLIKFVDMPHRIMGSSSSAVGVPPSKLTPINRQLKHRDTGRNLSFLDVSRGDFKSPSPLCPFGRLAIVPLLCLWAADSRNQFAGVNSEIGEITIDCVGGRPTPPSSGGGGDQHYSMVLGTWWNDHHYQLLWQREREWES